MSSFRVRYSETDQMGVVYHSHYLVWCEIGRTDFIRRLGTSYAELERRGVRLAVVEARLRYGAAARYDEMIRVRTRLTRVQSRTLEFAYEIETERTRGDAPRRLATASTTLRALGPDNRPRTLPAELLAPLRAAVS
ncbi:MAG TPA: thioesterase family protein [Longimicrobiales bacterium]|nr:thioesterase family protein [Longimicrobiales bacterium]